MTDLTDAELSKWLRLAADRCCQCTDGHHPQANLPFGTDEDVRVPRDIARHLASRLATIEAERDEWQKEARETYAALHEDWNRQIDRAEKAEAERDTAREQLAALVAKVEALADEWNDIPLDQGLIRFTVPSDELRAILTADSIAVLDQVRAEAKVAPAPERVHRAPTFGPLGSNRMPCCGRTPLEAPITDRMTTDDAKVNCTGSDDA